MKIKPSERERLARAERADFANIRHGIDWIVDHLAESSEFKLFSGKKRIDEENFLEVMDIARRFLPADQMETAEIVADGVRSSLQRVASRYSVWAVSKAKSMAGHYGVDPIEACSVGGWAIYRACFRFIPGAGFSSYLEDWIRQGLERVSGKVYHKPEKMKGPDGKEIPYDADAIDGHDPTRGWFETRCQLSLNNPLGDNGDSDDTFMDRVIGDLPNASIMLEDRGVEHTVIQLMNGLPPQERSVVYGWWFETREPSEKEIPIIQEFARRAAKVADL